jgi:hypothetical protein
MLNGEKVLKGIITNLSSNMTEYYDNKLDDIEIKIK